MNIIVTIPDGVAARLASDTVGLERQALEALVLESYRAGRLTIDELGAALGLETLDAIDGFLKRHGLYEDVGLEDLGREREKLNELGV